MSATDPLQPVAVLHSGHPLAGPCQASKQPHGGVSRQLLIIHYFPSAVSDRVRFFSMWLRRIAPDTHQDQASGDALPVALAASPPQKNVGAATSPMGSSHSRGCRCAGANPFLARVAGDPLHCKSVTATRYPIHSSWLWLQSASLACRAPS